MRTVTKYICDVCESEFSWSEDSASLWFLKDKGPAGYELHFCSCSDNCRKKENLKAPLVAWMERKNIPKSQRNNKLEFLGLN